MMTGRTELSGAQREGPEIIDDGDRWTTLHPIVGDVISAGTKEGHKGTRASAVFDPHEPPLRPLLCCACDHGL